ncbi:carbohydrate-binding protein [Streptomyces sp. NPDC059957]|uniref:carbohydrate-binding protein n=1 Tax=unclassified Streptomyces TaxID=2593676 RepID=UPI00364857D2
MRFDNVDLGAPGPLTVSARVASAVGAGGAVVLRTGSVTGPLLAQFDITSTGGWQSWATRAGDPALARFAQRAAERQGTELALLRGLLVRSGAPDTRPREGHDMPGMVSSDTVRRAGALSGEEFDRVFATALRAHLTQSVLLCAGERASGGSGEARELAGELEKAGAEQLALLDAARSGKS